MPEHESPKSVQRISSRHEQLVDEHRAQLATGAQTLQMARPVVSAEYKKYLSSAGAVGICTLIGAVIHRHPDHSNVIMVYLLGVVFVATRYGRCPSIFAALVSITVFDFLFYPPYYSFGSSDPAYWLTLPIMLAVALIVSELSARLRDRMLALEKNEQFTAALYAMSRDLARARQIDEIKAVATRHIHDIFDCIALVLLPNAAKQIFSSGSVQLPPEEISAAQRSFDQCVVAYGGESSPPPEPAFQSLSGKRPRTHGYYIPLATGQNPMGVLAILPVKPIAHLDTEHLDLLVAFANQIAMALERAFLSRAAQEAALVAEREQIRSTLLSSVSHDLRTPLASITGAATSLLESSQAVRQPEARELCQSIVQESDRLNRLVANLLDMTKLESGGIRIRKDWQSLEEMVGSALTRLEKRLAKHVVKVELPTDLPLIAVDELLIEQVLINLLDNAAKYTPESTVINIRARVHEREMIIEVSNNGPSLSPGEEDKIFEKFYRGKGELPNAGAGLGLPICKGFVEAHGGRIWAGNRDGGGVSFFILLPIQQAPVIELETIQV
jgi:two-component system, OmpR family, sensor histidine kinase KdpD